MISNTDLENFKRDYYRDPKGQRLGQAFCNRFVEEPNPALFYDPCNTRAEGYIRRNYVYAIVQQWTLGKGQNIQLLMTETHHALLYNDSETVAVIGQKQPIMAPIHVSFDNVHFTFSWDGPTPGRLLRAFEVNTGGQNEG